MESAHRKLMVKGNSRSVIGCAETVGELAWRRKLPGLAVITGSSRPEKMGMTLEKRASFHEIPVLIYSVASTVIGTA